MEPEVLFPCSQQPATGRCHIYWWWGLDSTATAADPLFSTPQHHNTKTPQHHYSPSYSQTQSLQVRCVQDSVTSKGTDSYCAWFIHVKHNDCKFKVSKSVHHRTIQINHQPDATIFSFLSWRLFAPQQVSGVFPPIIRSSMTAVAASVFIFVSWWPYRGDSRAVFVVGPASGFTFVSWW